MSIQGTGLVTSVGLSAAASCAAIRAALSNHTDTRFKNDTGEWIIGAQVALDEPWRGKDKLVQMLRLAVAECLKDEPPPAPKTLPLLLCVAEEDRAGRLEGLGEDLFVEVSRELDLEFHPELSAVIAYGRVGGAVALSRARQVLDEHGVTHVLIAAADSLLVWPTLFSYQQQGRLLTLDNSNGFIPGEGAAAVLVGAGEGSQLSLFCVGLGFAEETATVTKDEPLKGAGLTTAIKQALADADCDLNALDFRITDNSGEQYYFKEASLAYTRTARFRKKEFDIWHPADCIGETGSVIGLASLAVADAACRRGYAHGPGILVHCGSDTGQRAAVVLRWGVMP